MNETHRSDNSCDPKTLTDEELIRKSCADPPDADAREELAARSRPKLRKTIEINVFAKGICPRGCDKHAFVDDAASRANENFLQGLRSYGFEKPFDAWLYAVATNALIDEVRKFTGRGRQPRPEPEPIDDTTREIAGSSRADSNIRARELAELTVRLLALHAEGSNRNAKSAFAIKLRAWDDYGASEIAEKIGMTKGSIDHLFSDDYQKLSRLLKEKFGISSLRQLL